MGYIEKNYNKLNKIVKLKSDYEFQKELYAVRNIYKEDYYNQKEKELLDDADIIIRNLSSYINDRSQTMSDLEIDTIDRLESYCCNCSQDSREQAFKLLEDTVCLRMEDF